MPEPRGCTVWELLADVDTGQDCCGGFESKPKADKTSAFSGAIRQRDAQEHASGKKLNEDIKKLLMASKKRGWSFTWTRGEEQAILNLQDSACRNDWDTIVKHPELAGRTLNQIKSKCKNMCARQKLNSQSNITTQHRRQRRNLWTKEEEQPLLDLLLKQSTTDCIDWDGIAKCPALVDRTVKQIKEKWKGLKARGATLPCTSSTLWSAEEDYHVLELYECITEAGSVSGKLKLVAKAFPGRTQTAVQKRYYVLMRKHAKEESDKNVLEVSVDDTLTTKCNTTDAAVIHKEENALQLDKKHLSKRLLKHSESARSCGDDDAVDTGASEQHALNRAADNAVRLAKKRRVHIMMHPHKCISEQSSSQNVGIVAEARSSTSSFKRSSNEQKRPRQGVVKTQPTSRRASKCEQHHSSWASLCPKLNGEKINSIISWPLFDV
jgi:hypothetical protein